LESKALALGTLAKAEALGLHFTSTRTENKCMNKGTILLVDDEHILVPKLRLGMPSMTLCVIP